MAELYISIVHIVQFRVLFTDCTEEHLDLVPCHFGSLKCQWARCLFIYHWNSISQTCEDSGQDICQELAYLNSALSILYLPQSLSTFLNLVSFLLLFCLIMMLFDFIFPLLSYTSSSSMCCFFSAATIQPWTEDLSGKCWKRLFFTLFHWPLPPSHNLSLSFILYHWQWLYLSVLWVCCWVSVQVVEVLAGGLCPEEHVLMIPLSGNQRKCLHSSCHTVQHWDYTVDVC